MAQKPLNKGKVSKIYELFENGSTIAEIVIKLDPKIGEGERQVFSLSPPLTPPANTTEGIRNHILVKHITVAPVEGEEEQKAKS